MRAPDRFAFHPAGGRAGSREVRTERTMTSVDDRSNASSSRFASRWGRRSRMILALLGVLLLAYLVYLIVFFSVFYGRDVFYPTRVLEELANEEGLSGPLSREIATGGATADPPNSDDPVTAFETPQDATETGQQLRIGGVQGGERQSQCSPSRTVAMQEILINFMVVENTWVPAHPLYKLGFFGVVDFAATPWFDNKAAEQIGMLDVSRRLAIELTDSLGRVRGTSLQNEELSAAQATLRVDERAWYVNNPFNSSINTISPSASEAFARAIPLYRQYNRDLAACDAIFDTRADNLRETLSRFTAALGSTVTELAQRTSSFVYNPKTDRFEDGPGNDAGWLDFKADNYFHRARGQMYALHGILQGMRVDFHQVLVDRNVHAVWDKMEEAVAEAAVMDPLIVSNGGPDSLLMPDHLGKMSEMILRSRTAMVELRDILSD
jgi:hypothetical protein